MLLLQAVRNRQVRLLWLGQVYSAMGDEIYRVAFIWLCVQMIGSETGYLASLMLLAGIIMSIFGARLVDHLHSEEAMIRLDLLRGAIVLIPVVLHLFNIPSFTALAICGLAIAGLSSLFEPVIMETVPKVATEPGLLKAANGLMSTTFRMARVLGPMVIGLLSGFIPMIHFFTIDASTYFVSAWSIHSLRIPKAPAKKLPPITWRSFLDHLIESSRLLKTRPPVFRSLVAKSITGGAWNLAYGIGFAMLANEISPGNISTFGMMVAVYGVGNIAGALYFGSLQRHNPEKMTHSGLIWLGFTFGGLAMSKSMPLILVFSALSAFGGPWNDLPFVDLVQAHYPRDAISKIFRLRYIVETSAMLALMVISPVLFDHFSVRSVIFGCAVIMLACGVWGELGRRADSSSPA